MDVRYSEVPSLALVTDVTLFCNKRIKLHVEYAMMLMLMPMMMRVCIHGRKHWSVSSPY
jgi:hypothetical protein